MQLKSLFKHIQKRHLIFPALMIFGFLLWTYYLFNPGAALFDPNDNFPWRSEDRTFSIKLVEEENTRGKQPNVYNVAFSNNGFITSEYLHHLNNVGSEPFSMNFFVFKEYDEKRKDWLKSLTYEGCLRVNDSISTYLDNIERSKEFPTIEIHSTKTDK